MSSTTNSLRGYREAEPGRGAFARSRYLFIVYTVVSNLPILTDPQETTIVLDEAFRAR